MNSLTWKRSSGQSESCREGKSEAAKGMSLKRLGSISRKLGSIRETVTMISSLRKQPYPKITKLGFGLWESLGLGLGLSLGLTAG